MRQRKRRRGAPATFERQLWAAGVRLIGGVDEAGRGAWAGPVVAVAVIMPKRPRIPWVNDCKLLRPDERRQLWEEIRGVALAWGVGIVGPERIAEVNVLRATFEAMVQAVHSLHPPAEHLLVDGCHVPKFSLPCRAIVDGDQRCYSIAAASVGAKVIRDSLMEQLAAQFPQYGFERHKGYGTKDHQRALREHGPCSCHRLAYAPLQRLLQGNLNFGA
ncbi:MAG: ribonuclease HII [Armatimonadetes bacterium]|nr:ribonuclease HII [Armatimonadota bacterium]